MKLRLDEVLAKTVDYTHCPKCLKPPPYDDSEFCHKCNIRIVKGQFPIRWFLEREELVWRGLANLKRQLRFFKIRPDMEEATIESDWELYSGIREMFGHAVSTYTVAHTIVVPDDQLDKLKEFVNKSEAAY